jgi:putative DNA primase/helicase
LATWQISPHPPECLLASNDPPWLFRTAARLVWIDRDDAGAPFVRPLDEDRMMHALARIGDWRRVNAKGESYQVHPPLRVVKNLLATANPAVPVLAGIVAAPIFGRDGTIETKPGYLRGSAVLFEAEAGFTVGAIPDRPMEDEVKAARSLLLDELLGDFPFTTEVERVHALSLLLLPFVRAMIEGPTPLHLIEKPTPGTGATLMVDAIATITTGRPANIMTEGRDEDEWRKRLTAKLRSMPVMLVIDNVRSKLDSSALAAALTAPSWEDRLLGRSEMIHFPIRCAWIATGNNPELSNEMARRIVRIRLDAGIDQPWRRQTFRHPDLLSWIRRERAGLVRGSLILIQNWIAKGRLLSQKRIGSFEASSATMGGIIEAAGLGGFLDNTDELYQRSDSESEALRAFIAAWWDRFGLAPTRIGELLPLALDAEPSLPVFAASEQGQRVRLGNLLQRTRDRVFNITGRELRITRAGINQGNMRWRLTVIDLTCRTPEDIDEVSLRRSRWVSNHDDSPVKAQQYQCRGESGGSGETILYTRKDHRPPYIIIGGSTHHDPNRQLSNCFCVEISGEGALRRVTARCSVARAPPPGDRYSSDRMT